MPAHPLFQKALSLVEKDDPKVLQLTIGSRKVTPGEKIPKGEARGIPKLGWSATPDQKFLVISLDLDAPFPSFAPLGPILHWLQAGLTVDASSGELASSDPVIAFWAPPGPPPISSPHRYLFFLYDQPADFDATKFTRANGYAIKDRMRWDLTKFEKEAKLGSAVAATYFLSN